MNVVKLVTLHFYESATTITATNKQALFYKNKQKKNINSVVHFRFVHSGVRMKYPLKL